MASRWRYGCDTEITVYAPRGYGYVEYTTRCGSTAHNGGINQCEECERKFDALPLPDEDEGDLEWDDRCHGGDW